MATFGHRGVGRFNSSARVKSTPSQWFPTNILSHSLKRLFGRPRMAPPSKSSCVHKGVHHESGSPTLASSLSGSETDRYASAPWQVSRLIFCGKLCITSPGSLNTVQSCFLRLQIDVATQGKLK